MMTCNKICTFEIDGEIFGTDVLLVEEVISSVRIYPVPNAPELYLGLLNLRGLIIPLMNLHQKFKVTNKAIILHFQDKKLGLNIAKFGDVITLEEESQNTFIGESNSSELNNFISGKIKSKEGKIINIIDVNKIFNF